VCSKVTIIANVSFLVPSRREPIAIVDDEHRHILVIGQVGKKLGRDEEVLAAVFSAGNLDKFVVNSTFILDIHALKKLVR
jgi:hypothetical protein